jgi:MoxR-like ATPase
VRVATPAAGSRPARSDLLSRLGLFGLQSIEVPVLAALASEVPLLLLGDHGSGKSLLLERVATALGLAWRHYNASLLNFDDLVGYPLPDDSGGLRYVQTPASVWGAEAVFIDELSRARVDIQNRLFPIIHERRVQGLPLERLRFRWAAMNPPPVGDDDGDYVGSQPLDLALADRFGFHVRVPDWLEFPEAAREKVVRAGGAVTDTGAGAELARVLREAQLQLPVVEARWGAALARYLRIAAGTLQGAGLHWSGRRAGLIYRNILAVHAVREVAAEDAAIADSVWLAVLHSQPFAAAGRACDLTKLLAVHKEAWRLAEARPDDVLVRILAEPDPLRRVQLAVGTAALAKADRSAVVTDVLAQFGPGGAHALACWLVDGAHLSKLSVVAIDTVGEWYNAVTTTSLNEQAHPGSSRFAVWNWLKGRLAELSTRDERLAGALVAAFAGNPNITQRNLQAIEAAFRGVAGRLDGGGP